LTGLVSQASIVESSSFKDAFGLNNYVSLGEAINKSQVTDFKIALAGSQIDNIAIVPTITTTINNETFVNRA
jgi:hypothetical protein